MTEDKKELKKCPFCGGEGYHHEDGTNGFWIQCEDCDGKCGGEINREQAIKAWNTRQPPQLKELDPLSLRFKGRRCDNGEEWEGCLIKDENDGTYYIARYYGVIDESHEVLPETVEIVERG